MRASDGRLVHVNDVQNGLECGCLCPACKSPLIARQGKRRIWHFAHVSEVDCDSAGETALHLVAKQTLKDLNGKIRFPEEVLRKAGWPSSNQRASKPMARLNDLMTLSIPERLASESSVRIEPQDWAHQGFRPDAVLEANSGKLLVEIRVTHEVDEEKRRRMQKVGLGAIEIDLSEAGRHIAPDELASLVISEAPRKWLVFERNETRKKREAEFTEILENEASRLNSMVPRDLTRNFYVNACPRRNEPDFESVYVDQCMNCECCGGRLVEFRDTPLWNMLDDKIMHADESSVLCAHRDNSINLPTERQKEFVCELARDDLNGEGGLKACLPNGWEKDKEFCSAFIAAHPECKRCGWKMALRRNAKEQLFWGCRKYPSCRGTSAYRPEPPLDSIILPYENKRRKILEDHEKISAERAALARPKASPHSLSQRATPSSRRPTKG